MNEQYLWEKLGTEIQHGLENDQIFEVMLNPDQSLWFNHKNKGNIPAGKMCVLKSTTLVHALAQYENKFLNETTPYLDATLPFNGERINITVPPICEAPSFNIRKKSAVVISLNDYVKAEIMTKRQQRLLTTAIENRKNILVSGSPASGKTTLTNALLDTMSQLVPQGHRVLVLEQVPELQCSVENAKYMVSSEHVSIGSLLWIAMRNSPDRIVIGEVRDGSALDMLKAWNTGCPGGIATIHANHPEAAVQRVLDLACEVTTTPPYSLAAEALDIIVQIEANKNHPAGRQVTGICEVKNFNTNSQSFSFNALH